MVRTTWRKTSPMLVASDTSPISNLAIIGRLDLLEKQFREIWIPNAVESELSKLPYPHALASVQQGLLRGWIKARALQAASLVHVLQTGLGQGEAETIALGLELPADLILLDELAGRAAAARAGLRVTGVLGVLLRAKQQGYIPMLKPELASLRSKARLFIAASLEQEVLRNAGE
jgi:predicted nucleic acid-binding protein